jgi:hypothetical protein
MYLPTTIKVALSHLSGCYICDEDPEERRERLRARALAELDEPIAVRPDDGRGRNPAVAKAAWRGF